MRKMYEIWDIARIIGISSLSKGVEVSPLKLQKLLYYVQMWYMVKFGRQNTLFQEVPQAWQYGPVYPDIFDRFKQKKKTSSLSFNSFLDEKEKKPIKAVKKLIKKIEIQDDELEFIYLVLSKYDALSQEELVLFTHSEQPWRTARHGLAPFENSDSEIDLDEAFCYYTDKNKERNFIAV